MNTNEKGNVGLAKVITKLIELGYSCFLPFTDTTCVDLVVGNSKMELKRLQVKFRKKTNKGTIEIPFESVVNGKRILIDKSKIDYFVVYCPDDDQIYFIDLEKIGNVKTFSIRFNKPKNGQLNVNYATDFKFFEF